MIKILRRIYSFLLPEERKTSHRVVLSIVMNALLDFVSLAALLPVLYYLLEGQNNHRAALLFCSLAVGVVVMKCLVSTWLIRFQNRFLLSLYKRLSRSLYASYYNRGLLFIREQGSHRLDYEVNAFCFGFSQSLLAPMAAILGDGLLLVLVTVVLLIYAPLTAFILTIAFLPFVILYTQVIRKRAKLYGELEQKARREQFKLVAETFQGYSELKVSNAFHLFRTEFEEGTHKISDYRMKMVTLARLPMLLSELSIVIGLALLVLFGHEDVKILVGIFAVAAFRLLPAMRSILSGWTRIHNSLFILESLEEGLCDYIPEENHKGTPLPFNQSITLSHLHYTYPNGEEVLKDFNAVIHKGEDVGFSGYSGVGKSTLFNLLLGFLRPDSGSIQVDGAPLTKETQTDWLSKVGYVSQEVFLFNGTIAENIAIGSKEINRKRVRQILSDVSLLDWVDTLPDGIDTVLGERGCKVSGGQRQRIGIARALYRNIEILLLDEATSSLDDETEADIMATLARLKQCYQSLTILSIAHRKSSLAQCDRIINLQSDTTTLNKGDQ